jgi:hypothetical protein
VNDLLEGQAKAIELGVRRERRSWMLLVSILPGQSDRSMQMSASTFLFGTKST